MRFALACKERVDLLTQYQVEANKVIKGQQEQLYICHEAVETEKKKNKYLLPGAAMALGFLVGFFVVR